MFAHAIARINPTITEHVQRVEYRRASYPDGGAGIQHQRGQFGRRSPSVAACAEPSAAGLVACAAGIPTSVRAPDDGGLSWRSRANIANLLLARRRATREMLSAQPGSGTVLRRAAVAYESVMLASLGGALGSCLRSGACDATFLLSNGQENFTLHAELNWTCWA